MLEAFKVTKKQILPNILDTAWESAANLCFLYAWYQYILQKVQNILLHFEKLQFF